MSLDAETMANYIIDSMGVGGNLNKFITAICNYINSNCEIKYSWSGTSSASPYVDPITEYTAKPNLIATSFSISNSSEPGVSQADFQDKLSLNCIIGKAILAESGFLVSAVFKSAKISFTLNSNKTTRFDAIKEWSELFIDSFKSKYFDATPISGSHNQFSGVAIMKEIK